jgi:endonuclease YncB( thermonuclease family)
VSGFLAKIVEVIDGDTVVTEVDLSAMTFILGAVAPWPLRHHVRFLGVDAPERNTEAGKAAKAWLTKLALGQDCLVEIVKVDKYGGREDGNVWLAGDPMTLAQHVIETGHGKPYGGGKR